MNTIFELKEDFGQFYIYEEKTHTTLKSDMSFFAFLFGRLLFDCCFINDYHISGFFAVGNFHYAEYSNWLL